MEAHPFAERGWTRTRSTQADGRVRTVVEASGLFSDHLAALGEWRQAWRRKTPGVAGGLRRVLHYARRAARDYQSAYPRPELWG